MISCSAETLVSEEREERTAAAVLPTHREIDFLPGGVELELVQLGSRTVTAGKHMPMLSFSIRMLWLKAS